MGSIKFFSLNQFLVLNCLFNETRNIKDTPAAHKYCKLDLSSILRGNIKFPFSISSSKRKNLKFDNIDERFFSAYIRFEVEDRSGVLSNITNIFSKNKVSIKRLVQNPDKNKKSSSIIIITHKSKDKFLKKILKEISKKNYIKKKPKLIRIDDISDTNADVVAAGPAPSPWIMLWPIGLPSIITAFKTPSMPAT